MSTVASEINVGDRASKFAQRVKKAARKADNEEELRIEMESAIRDLASDLDMDVDPENERTVLSGRPDAVYGDLVIEYKDPNHSGDWENEALYGRNESDSGLIDYMYDIATERATDETEQEVLLDGMVGVGTNGYRVFFCRYRPQKRIEAIDSRQANLAGGLSREEVTGAVELVDVYDIEEGARAFLTYLRSLSRKPLTSSKLANSFGPDGEVAQEAIQELYLTLQKARENGNPRVETLYEEWSRVFGIVYGEEMGQIQDDRQDFGNVYGVKDPQVKPLLFSVHTYYGLLMKMLVTELLAVVREAPIEEAGLYEPNDDTLKRKLQNMETGRQYEQAGLYDFFEEGFFGWYLDAWNEEVANQVRSIADEMTTFEPATPTIKSEVVRDILKDLYQDLVPEVIRHDLGEYLTPDWLAEYVIEEVDYEGEGRLLDPACGSGTFLVEAIDSVREETSAEGEELLDKILDSVVGFDLNPISVIASRTNYLMALGELAFHSSDVRIPVYQSDSILTPSKYVDITSGGETYRIHTREGEFRIPAFDTQREIESFLSKTKEYIQMDSPPKEFTEVALEEFDLGSNWGNVVEQFYSKIYELEQEDRDGVWASLLRNRMAPVFSESFDYVVGNPPYVYWENLSENYRQNTEDLWERYQMFQFSEYRGDSARNDISILMTYVALDEYLKSGGELGFLITQTIFKSHRGGHGFRRLTIPGENGGEDVSIKAIQVDDLSDFNPFEGVSNQTAVMHLQKGEKTSYPVDYRIWRKQGKITTQDSLKEVLDEMDIATMKAEPVNEDDPQSEWLTLEPKAIDALRKTLGESEYQAREGSNTIGADGIYHIDLLEDRDDSVLIENLSKEGRKKSIRNRGNVKGEIEKGVIYPNIKGRHIDSWGTNGGLHLLLPHKNTSGPHNALSKSEMRTKYPKSFQYLQDWQDILADDRPLGNFAYYDEDIDPFYFVGNVGEYSFAPYKMAWREVADGIQATVLEPTDKGLGEAKPVVPTHTVIFIPFWERKPAHYACAIMNSSFTKLLIEGYISLHPSPHILENVNIPEYDEANPIHTDLADLSIELHETESEERIEELETKIDYKVGELYGSSEEEVSDVIQSLKELP